MLPWVLIVIAAVCEMIWPVGMKYTKGFTSNIPMIIVTVAIMTLSFVLMLVATRDHRMHVGTAYAIWTGLGAAGTAVLGIYMLDEPRNIGRVICIFLVVVGVVGLKLFSPPEDNGTQKNLDTAAQTSTPVTPPDQKS